MNGVIEIENGTSVVENKELEPRRVVFMLSLHLKEKITDKFLGDTRKEDLTPERVYEVAPHNQNIKEPLRTTNGRSLKALEMLAKAQGMKLIGIKWRNDVEKSRKTGAIDNGLGLLLEFGYGKSDLAGGDNADAWDELARSVFEDYLWDCAYYEGGNRIGLFGPNLVVEKKDGTKSSDDPGRQLVLNGVKTMVVGNGLEFSWGGKKVSMEFPPEEPKK